MEGITRVMGAHPWIGVAAGLLLLLAAGFAVKKIKVLAITLAACAIIVFYFVFRSGAPSAMKPGDINKLRDTTKQKVMESIKKEFRR